MTRDFCDRSSTPEGRRRRSRPADGKDRVTIHRSTCSSIAPYGGGVDQRITWMGSHNFTDNALQRNDGPSCSSPTPRCRNAFSELRPVVERSRNELGSAAGPAPRTTLRWREQ